MSDARILAAQAAYWVRATLRTPRLVVFSMLFPVILLLLFNSMFNGAGATVTLASGQEVDGSAYFTGGMLTYSVMLTCFTSLLITLTTQRETGELKRYRGTPVPAWTFIVSFILRSLAIVAAMTVLMLAIAHFAYDVKITAESLGGIIVYVVLGAMTFCALGIAGTALADSADAASSIGPFVAVILSLFSGIFVPIDQLPNWLESVARVFPPFHLADGLQTALAGSGSGLTADNVSALAIWGIVGIFVAVRRFRWEPQVGRG